MSTLIIDAYPRLTKVDKSREIGIEIEIEGDRLVPRGSVASVDKWWTTHEDGSLRGNAIEYVLHTPVNRKHVAPALSALKTAFKAVETVINDSDRAGVHVHVNCQSLTVDQVINYLLVYYIFEDALVRYCGEEREGNLFCLRAQDAEGLLSALRQAKRTGSFSNFREESYRYASVNIPALMKFGTLEFRSLKTPQNIEDINPWVEMLIAMKDESLNFQDSKQIIETFSQSGEHAYLKKVFGKQAKKLNCDDLSVMLRNGVRRIQDVAYTSTAPKVTSKKKYTLTNAPNDNPGNLTNDEWVALEQQRVMDLRARYCDFDPNGTPRPQRDRALPDNIGIYWDRNVEGYTLLDTLQYNQRPYPGLQIQPGQNAEQEWVDNEDRRLDDVADRYWPVREAIDAGLVADEPVYDEYWIERDQQIMWDDQDHRWAVVRQDLFERRPYEPPQDEPQPVPRQLNRNQLNRNPDGWRGIEGLVRRPVEAPVAAGGWQRFYNDAVAADRRPDAPPPQGAQAPAAQPRNPAIGDLARILNRAERELLEEGDPQW